MTTSSERSSQVESSDTIEAIEECYRMGWSDGLPVVPPADYKVQEMLRYAGMTGEEELLSFEMRSRVLTSENVAANAVMAGCLPEYFPVLVTTLLPRPGTLDRGTLGNPSKYTLCIAENEEDSPWEPLHVSHGFKAEDSCVTIAVAYNPITVNNAYGHTGESILASIADTLKSACLVWRFPSQWVLVIGPEHAITLQADGWSRRGIQDYLIENATRPLSELIRLGIAQGPEKPGDDKLVRRCSRDPEDIIIVMGGGTGGRNSAIIDTTNFKIRTRKVDMSVVTG